jgi:hypothetical protein
MTASGPRLCKDCRHFVKGESRFHPDICGHPSSAVSSKIDLVTGEAKPGGNLHCHAARGSLSEPRCGWAAIYFEEREP